MTASLPPNGDCLARRLGFWSSTGFVVGMTIGSGIFRTPAAVAARVPSAPLVLGVWLVGGVITMCGALSIAELASARPQAGGLYVYLRDAWGRGTAFVFVWSELVLIRAAGLGGIATVFGEYVLRSFGVDPAEHPLAADYAAVSAIVVATAANIRGVGIGALLTGLSSVAKFGALVFVVGVSMLMGAPDGGAGAHFAASSAPVESGALGLALISVLWAYDGFADLPFLGGEVVNPARTIPRALIVGTLAIVAIYLAANIAYLWVLPLEAIARSPLIAADVMARVVGPVGVAFVSVVVMVSTFGAVNADLLGAPRIFFAAAADGLFFKALARVHPRHRTPHVSILLSAGLGIAFVLTGTFEQLADTFVLAIWPFYGLAVAGLYRLRRSQPHADRPYLVPLYPVVPAIFIAAVLYLVGSALTTDPMWTALTFGVILAGVPVYLVAFHHPRR